MSAYLISESRTIHADAQRLFDIVADPAQHPVIDGSGSVQASQPGAPERLSEGAKFGMDMKIGASYKILNTVVEFDEGKRIAWRHFNGHIWRYLFEPAADGATGAATVVTEQWDARKVWNRPFLALVFGKRNRAGIVATLERLDEVATGKPSS
jgi:hypothetical protein